MLGTPTPSLSPVAPHFSSVDGHGVGHAEGRDSDPNDVCHHRGVTQEGPSCLCRTPTHSLSASPGPAGALWWPLQAFLEMLLDLHTGSSVRTSLSGP